MKRITIILIVLIMLISCEKERCFECTTTCTAFGYTETVTQIFCGDFTRQEARDMAMSMTTTIEGITCKVECVEQ